MDERSEVEFTVERLDDRPAIPASRRGFRRRAAGAAALAGMLVAVALLAAGRAGWRPFAVAAAPPVARIFSLVGAGMPCLQDAAWARDGARVAFVGYDLDCGFLTPDPRVPNPPAIHGRVVVYDADTRQIVARLAPDAAIQRQLAGDPGGPWQVRYQHVLWSPDQTALALTFLAVQPGGAPNAVQLQGLAIVALTGKLVKWMVTPTPQELIVWDTQTGAVVSATSAGAAFPFLQDVPAAPYYGWGAGGAFGAPAAFPARPAAADPPGNADGDQVFSRWQPGEIFIFAPYLFWHTAFEAWSPDGRYFADGAATGGRVAPANDNGATDPALGSLGLSGVSTVPMRDAALAAAFALLDAQARTQTAAVAWRPDDSLLAVYDTSLLTVHLFRTSDGREAFNLAVPNTGEATAGADRLLLWSPDGRRLMLVGAQVGAALFWTL